MIQYIPLALIGFFGSYSNTNSRNDISIVYDYGWSIDREDITEYSTITNDLLFSITADEYFTFENNGAESFDYTIQCGVLSQPLESISRASDETLRSLTDNWLSYQSYNYTYNVSPYVSTINIQYNLAFNDINLVNALLNGQELYFYCGISYSDSVELSSWLGENQFIMSVANYVYSDDYASGYEDGYNSGYADGDSYGYNIGYYNGNNDGINRGYSQGYNQGLNDSDGLNKSFKTMLFTILDYPVHFVSEVFNVEFFGINLFSAFTFVITIGLIAFVIKRFL